MGRRAAAPGARPLPLLPYKPKHVPHHCCSCTGPAKASRQVSSRHGSSSSSRSSSGSPLKPPAVPAAPRRLPPGPWSPPLHCGGRGADGQCVHQTLMLTAACCLGRVFAHRALLAPALQQQHCSPHRPAGVQGRMHRNCSFLPRPTLLAAVTHMLHSTGAWVFSLY